MKRKRLDGMKTLMMRLLLRGNQRLKAAGRHQLNPQPPFIPQPPKLHKSTLSQNRGESPMMKSHRPIAMEAMMSWAQLLVLQVTPRTVPRNRAKEMIVRKRTGSRLI